jgi:hypothetical protein
MIECRQYIDKMKNTKYQSQNSPTQIYTTPPFPGLIQTEEDTLLVLFVASVFLDPVQQSTYHEELTSSHVTYNSINFMLCLPLCISLLTVQSACTYTWQCSVFFCLYQARKGRGRVYLCWTVLTLVFCVFHFINVLPTFNHSARCALFACHPTFAKS